MKIAKFRDVSGKEYPVHITDSENTNEIIEKIKQQNNWVLQEVRDS